MTESDVAKEDGPVEGWSGKDQRRDTGQSTPDVLGARKTRLRLAAAREILERGGRASVEELVAALGVSAATVRRDLARLEREGHVVRSHGGAVLLERGFEIPISYRALSQAAEKRRIAHRAAALVSDGSVVGITGGTTTMEVARAIANTTDLTVVTNALDIGAEMAARRNVRLVLTGGTARTASFELSGPIAERTIHDYNLDLVFVGVDGVDAMAGFTTHNDLEARTNAALVQRASKVVVVADSTKLGQVKFARICDLQDADLLISDEGAPEEQVGLLRSAGLDVVLV